ncbi:hypothetical protein GCM10020295_03270 [Streptomyces cinereospinus]
MPRLLGTIDGAVEAGIRCLSFDGTARHATATRAPANGAWCRWRHGRERRRVRASARTRRRSRSGQVSGHQRVPVCGHVGRTAGEAGVCEERSGWK